MKKFLTVIGNRPQLVKYDNKFKQVLVYTGQHYDKLLKDVFFKGLKISKPDYDLGETKLGKMIDKLIKVVQKEVPQYIIVYGDTRSTLAGAMAALSENIPLIHIEAGCRSFNDRMPEERIRKIVDEIALIHFTPSMDCKERLEENTKHTNVYNVGATQIDSMFKTFPTKKLKDAYTYSVATIHRESNTQEKPLKAVLRAFGASESKIRLYLHPRTEKVINKYKIVIPKNVKLLKPIPYKKMINEIAFADKIITDSGGLQVEAFFLRRPCITLRNETEWTETVDQGWNKIVGTNEKMIVDALTKRFIRGKGDMYVYGGGDAKYKIRTILDNL